MFAQKDYINNINQFNSEGEKDGYWIEDRSYELFELYYKNGIKSGVFKRYSKKGELNTFGEYKNDKMSGTWYYFGDKGHLIMIQKDFSINTDTVILDTGKEFVYKHKCYTISFYPNGIKKSEGILLWEDSPEMDDVYEYGEWNYYNEYGELINTKLFK
jgi:antitoxin component YwqK of YwqJK toxin-antitoxin module